MLASNVAAVRRRRGLTVRELSARLGEWGVKLLPSGVTKIEQGQRGVDAAELIALAAVLNVSPARLLLPAEADAESVVALTPLLIVPTHQAWRWMEGLDTLPRPGPTHEAVSNRPDPSREREDLFAYQDERPALMRQRERHPLARAVARLAHAVEWAIRPGRQEDVQRARAALERVAAELDELEQEVRHG